MALRSQVAWSYPQAGPERENRADWLETAEQVRDSDQSCLKTSGNPQTIHRTFSLRKQAVPKSAAKTSERFSRAARAERDRLARKEAQLKERRESLQGKINELDGELAAVASQIRLIETVAESRQEPVQVTEISGKPEESVLLTGATIRQEAIPVLLHDRGGAPVHYREWLEMLHRHGYRVAGKRPEAVFLNQVTRSPVVRATTQTGYYEIDLEAIPKLQRAIAQLVGELAQVSEKPLVAGGDYERRLERQRELSRDISRAERRLEEATEALSALGDQAPAIRAA